MFRERSGRINIEGKKSNLRATAALLVKKEVSLDYSEFWEMLSDSRFICQGSSQGLLVAKLAIDMFTPPPGDSQPWERPPFPLPPGARAVRGRC